MELNEEYYKNSMRASKERTNAADFVLIIVNRLDYSK